jgi:hypothetical protein
LEKIMTKWKEGQRVKIVTRPVLAEDRRTNRYFEHMGGLTGEITNIYGPEEVAVRIEKTSLPKIAATVHTEATRRLRAKFLNSISAEAKSKLDKKELEFDANYMLLVRSEDLESA